ncbi:MAG TPA: RNA polymerase sigma factor [Kofleriaceae bacterium]|nr:RNA polymerase sigma factor [Kofleriaceae bacterium]
MTDAVTTPTQRAIDAVFRIEAPRLIAGLARITRDVGVAEELAQDAMVIALERWPVDGVPDNPGAWLMTTAKNRALDHVRRRRRFERKQDEVGATDALRQDERTGGGDAALVEAIDAHRDVGDDLLRLIFTCCHPVLSPDARVTLTLRLLGGLTTDEIARAFLAPEPTIAQRIVRAKRTLAEEHAGFELPRGDELRARTASVLEVLYLIFNEGYAATAGDDWTRPALCEDALRLGRILATLAPDDAEVHGLVALMELQASRLGARTGPDGAPVLLLDQDRTRWDRVLIRRGLAALARAEALAPAGARGRYTLQAAIAACHAETTVAAATNWVRIAALYTALAQVAPSPVVELNRGVAVAMAFGPAAGLAVIDPLLDDPALARYHLLPSVRGDLLARLGRNAEARAELERAASLTRNAREQALLRAKAAALLDLPDPPS